MLTTELIKQNIDLFNCLGLDGGDEHEKAKVIFEFDATENYPKGLVIHVAPDYNSDINDINYKISDTRSAIAVFLEGRGFIVKVIYRPWSEEEKFNIIQRKGRLLLVNNCQEVIVKKAIKYEYDPQTKKFSYFNGKETIFLDNAEKSEVDYYNVTGEQCFSFSEFDEPSVNHERLVFMSLEDIEPAFFALKADVVQLLQKRKPTEIIELKDQYWVEYPYPDGDGQKTKLFGLINNALTNAGGYKEINKICSDCREWEEEDDDGIKYI